MHLVLFHSFYNIAFYLCITCIFHVFPVHAVYYMWHPCPCTTYVTWKLYDVCGVCFGVLASDSSAQASRVQVTIQTLDENDNAPQLAEPYDTFVCDSAAPGQVSN